MRHPRTTAVVIALAIATSSGGLAGASTIGNPASKAPAVAPTLHTAIASVGGKRETILVSAKGLPVYFYRGDTATISMVSGELAGLWPPLVAKAPTAKGVTGKVTAMQTSNGHQVAYKGHFLYTFVEDKAGAVTGQGVSNFFVVTPGIAAEHTTSSGASAASSSAGSTGTYSNANNYGY
jgi:predicted lipoprotein with Yx(FWY)xxD motif